MLRIYSSSGSASLSLYIKLSVGVNGAAQRSRKLDPSVLSTTTGGAFGSVPSAYTLYVYEGPESPHASHVPLVSVSQFCQLKLIHPITWPPHANPVRSLAALPTP